MLSMILSVLTLFLAPPAALNFTMNSLDGKPSIWRNIRATSS
jgi:hypothetical protein